MLKSYLLISKDTKWAQGAIRLFYLISAVKRVFCKNDVFDICHLHDHFLVPSEQIHYPFWLESEFS